MLIKIGTRNSPLAIWQAEEVAKKIRNLGYDTELIPVVSSGDKNLTQPLYAMGIMGVFTRDLDIALLEGEVDIAVHSLKDVPTQMPQELHLIGHLERDFHQDVLVRTDSAKNKPLSELKIATSSLRRRAFWSQVFPYTEFVDIRGNVQTRLQKLNSGLADATLFSLAGLKRMELDIAFEELPFILSAPSQGVITIAGRKSNTEINKIVRNINHPPTQICVEIERLFLQTMEGGCTAPIGAFAYFLDEKTIQFHAKICSIDGSQCVEMEETIAFPDKKNSAVLLAEKMLSLGGKEIMEVLRSKKNIL